MKPRLEVLLVAIAVPLFWVLLCLSLYICIPYGGH